MRKSKKSTLNPMADLIQQGHRGVYGTKCVLARAFRSILYDSNMTYEQWSTLVQNYVTKQAVARNTKSNGSDRGNLHSKISRDRITWKSWLIVLAVFGYDSFDVKFSLKKKGVIKRELNFTVEDLFEDISSDSEEDKE